MVDKNSLNLELIDTSTPAQDWARIINENFAKIDYHNHTIYNGAPILSNDISGGTLDLNHKRIESVNRFVFTINDLYEYYSSIFVGFLGDLYYINDKGVKAQITNGNILNIADAPEGFTVVGADPIAVYSPASNVIGFFDEAGENTATILCESANLTDLKINDITITDLITETNIVVEPRRNYLCGVEAPSTFRFLSATYESFTTAELYKVSESGAFYYDDLSFNAGTSYDLSYFKGAKELIISTSTDKKQKTGTGYTLSEIQFTTDKIVSETFTIIPSLGDKKIVSICPVFKTTGATLSPDNFKESVFKMPVFRFIFNDDSVQVFAAYDFSSMPFETVILIFKLVLAEENITFGDP